MSAAYLKDWIIIGISGVTCGGKTSLANRLRESLAPVYVFNQDVYFYPDDSPHHVKCDNMEHNNYDILSSLDMERMHADVVTTLKGDVSKAHSAYEGPDEHRRRIPGKKFLVMEGFTLLNYEPLSELCHLRYYFVLDYDECVRRRSFRLYDPPDVAGYFEQCVWPEHVRYKMELEGRREVTFLDGTDPDAYEKVVRDLCKING